MVLSKHNGFSFIELMIAIAVSSVVGLAVYQVQARQQRSHVAQQLSVEMQQNLRAVISFMRREIRMAGYDPDGDAGAGIQTAGAATFGFSLDLDDDNTLNGVNERLVYGFTAGDVDGNGVADSGALSLVRQDPAGTPTTAEIAYDIQAIAFAYAFDADSDEQLDTSPGGNVIWAYDSDGDDDLDTAVDTNDDGIIDVNDTVGGSALTAPPFSLSGEVDKQNIRAVRIWLLGRTRFPVKGFTDNNTYVVGAQRVTPNDNYQHSLVVDTIICRNLFL